MGTPAIRCQPLQWNPCVDTMFSRTRRRVIYNVSYHLLTQKTILRINTGLNDGRWTFLCSEVAGALVFFLFFV